MTEIKQLLKPAKQRARARLERVRGKFFGSKMDRPDELHEFWRQAAPAMNEPAEYVAATGRSDALLALVADLPPGSRVLEVGCNAGRNLAHLARAGYVVEGVEINPHAVDPAAYLSRVDRFADSRGFRRRRASHAARQTRSIWCSRWPSLSTSTLTWRQCSTGSPPWRQLS